MSGDADTASVRVEFKDKSVEVYKVVHNDGAWLILSETDTSN